MDGSGQRHRHKCHQSMATSIARLRACAGEHFEQQQVKEILRSCAKNNSLYNEYLFVHLQIATLFHSVDGATLWLSQHKSKVSCELLEDYFPSVQNCFKIG